MNTKEKNVFQGFKMAVTHSRQCQSKFSIRTIHRFSFLFCLFLWVIMAVNLSTAYSYSDVSPHWNHIRNLLIDWRTVYLSDTDRLSQIDFGARNYDIVLGDGVVRNDSVYEYKRRNPNIKYYVYAINWALTYTPDVDYIAIFNYRHMRNWYTSHPQYNIEDAFLHDTNICPIGTSKTEACRLQIFVWDSSRWVINAADPGLQAYQAQRMKDIIAFNTYGGYEPDGILFDEHGFWDLNEAGIGPFNGRIREYSGVTDQVGAYLNDIITLLQIEKAAIPTKAFMLNPNIDAREESFSMITAAGAVYLEHNNNPFRGGQVERWGWVERLINNGVLVAFNTREAAVDLNSFPPGNFSSGLDRVRILWLASHYMVGSGNSLDRFNFSTQFGRYNSSFESYWYEAIGVDVGSPLGPRSVYRSGTQQSNGRSWTVWRRDFENAIILFQPMSVWGTITEPIFGDDTAVSIDLPSGDTYIPLYSDGTFGAPVSSITLRNAEAAILIKQGSLSPQLQFSSATYSVSEGTAIATISVMRAGISTSAVSVDYTTSNGTATAGSDYTAASGTLNWAIGDTAAKAITITIINDTVVEGNETVNIALSNPNGAQISGTNPVVLTITDNDSTGGNGGNNSGGGDTSSGGSGCGFVKDNGKGQGAKGEGILFAVMLVIILGGTTLARKLSMNYVFNQSQTLRRHFIKHTIALFLIGAFLGFFPALSYAATYYVSPTGAATWSNCSGSTPLNGTSACSWQTAMANAVAGDIVYFRGGTYNIGVIGSQRDYANMRPTNSGTAGNPITFIAYSGEVPNITGTVNAGISTAAYFGCSYTDYITWDRFSATLQRYGTDTDHDETQTWAAWGSDYCTLRNSTFTGIDVGGWNYNTSFVRIEDSNYSTVENNYFHDLTGTTSAVNTTGIWLFSSTGTTVRHNTFYHTRGGVYAKLAPYSADIYNNFIYNPLQYEAQDGIYISNSVPTPTGVFNIYQNVIVGCERGIRLVGIVGAVANAKIYNNSIYTTVSSDGGIYIRDIVTDVEVFNNIIYGSSPLLRYYTASTYSYANNNSFYHPSSLVWNLNYTTNYTSIASWTAATGFDANSITSDPLFVNAGSANPADYKLQASSPARTSGRGGSYATVMGAYITGNETIGYDPDAPRVEITSPASSTITTTNISITISGTASDTQGIVSVTCNNSRGGNCTCTGTTNWICSNIPLQSGQNIITVTATDGDNKTGIDAITVTVSSGSGDTGGNSGGNGSGDASASGGSGCGFVKDDGKGQKTKGEGVALMIMLIISLTMIFVLGRSTRRIKAISIILKAFILAIFMAVLLLPGVSLAANYYIDYQSGSDANSGTSKSFPWQQAPGMAGFSGVYTHQAGDNFIFKGGATWPSAAFPLTIGYSGDAAASDEYTVDKTWYAGSSWTRPVFDGENVTQKFITASNKHYIVIDNIEFTKSDTDYTDSYGNMPYPLYLTSISHWEIKNNYFHDLNAQYSGTLYDNGGYAIYIQASGGFISIHDNMAERVYMHRFAVVGPSSDFSTFEFYNNTVSDVAVGLVFGANNAYTFDNIQIHDNDFSKPYMPYADHSLDGSLTQLNGAIDALQTTINIVNGAVFTSGYNFVIQIGSEYIYVPAGGKTGNTLNNVTRGYAGSTAQAHVNLDSVGLTCSDPWHGDYIHIYQIGSGSITNAKIYNNYFHPGYSGPMPSYPCNSSTWDGGMTAYLYLENHLASPLIYNNIFEGDDEGISMQFSLRNAANPLVMNNTFIGSNKKIGLGIADASINAVVKNNIFSNVKYGITVSADSLSGFTSDNNNFHGLSAVGQFGALQCTGNSTFCSSLSDWQNILGGCPNAENDCSSSTDNPLLDSNYRLASLSPLTVRDAGAALSSYFSTDKDGVSRPQGSAWDIGAYEYCASGSCAGGGGGNGGDTGGNTGGSSGGESSSSGGSGCGFVRDDGKGQRAKGEGLSIIMPFLLLILFMIRNAKQLLKAIVFKAVKAGIAKALTIFIAAAFTLLFTEASQAATYYLSPTGNNSANGTSASMPWKTFANAFSHMVGGDELILLDGTYSEANGTGYISYLGTNSSQPQSGASLNQMTYIHALNPGQVTINGRLFIGRSFRKDSYIKISGITFEGGGYLYNTSYVTIKDCGFHGNFAIGTNDHHQFNDNNLIEDVWIWASGERIIAINYRSHNNVWRRVLVRGDGCGTSACSGSGNPNVGITVYESNNISLQNVIVVDRILADTDSGYADFAVAQHDSDAGGACVGCYAFGNNEWLGTMSINAPDHGYYMEPDNYVATAVLPPSTVTIRLSNAVAWNSSQYGFNMRRNMPNGWFENIVASARGGTAFSVQTDFQYTPASITDTVRNALIVGPRVNGAYTYTGTGISANAYNPYTTVSNAAVYGVGINYSLNGGICTSCAANIDPLSGAIPSLRYLTRIETGSPLKGAGVGGGDVGATILYRYGAENSRYGESGYNTLTGISLWPWPNEDRIKREMCVNTTRGFCSTGTRLNGTDTVTLTSYIWEYLGNACPQEICGSSGSDGGGGSGGGSGNNGGDASASGGSGGGCGFIKGKRLKANGEGLSFAIMLVVILGGTTLARKLSMNYVFNQSQTLRRHFIKHTIALFLIGAFLGFFPALSYAATYYVSPTGAATWPNCSGSTPLNGTSACSWQTAMASAVEGDIVYFRGGTYNVGIIGSQRDLANMRPTNSGTVGNPITFIAYPAEVPNITGTVINGSTAAYFGCSYNDYITWDGFAATMQIYTNADGSSTETQTWATWGSTYCTIRNSNFTGVHQPYYNNTSFVRVEGSNYALIENNYFHDLTSVQGVSVNTAAIYLFNSIHTTVKNNTMENTYGGVFTKLANSYVDIYNNFIHNGTNAGYVGIQTATGIANYSITVHNNIIIGYGVGINVVPTVAVDTYIIFNNTIYSGTNTHDGIHLGSSTTNAEVYNNIIANLSPSLRYFDGVASYSNYNNFYRAAGNVWNRNYATDYTSLSAWTAATGFDANSITSNPLFVNAGGANPADYKLQSNSPARTSGRGGSYATVMGAYITGNETIGYDPDAPRVEITSPANSTVTTTNASITLQGTASDTQGIVSVTCNNSRGGNCTCTGTINWTCSNIPLQSGQNIITVTATDGDNKTGIDVITVTVSSGSGDTGGNTGNSGGDTSSGGSGCGFVRDDGKGQGAKGEGLSMMMLIIALTVVFVLRRATKINQI